MTKAKSQEEFNVRTFELSEKITSCYAGEDFFVILNALHYCVMNAYFLAWKAIGDDALQLLDGLGLLKVEILKRISEAKKLH